MYMRIRVICYINEFESIDVQLIKILLCLFSNKKSNFYPDKEIQNDL